MAFYGKFDVVEVVKDVWTDVWNEHPATEEATVRIYLKEIIDIVQPRLIERSWEVKRQVWVQGRGLMEGESNFKSVHRLRLVSVQWQSMLMKNNLKTI